MTITPVASPPDEDTLLAWGAQFLNAMLDSRGELGTDFWTRARTALETSAATASFAEMTSKCAAKLECHGALSAGTTAVIGRLSADLRAPAVFGPFAELCRRDAVFVTATARIARDDAKAAAKAKKPAKAAPVSSLPDEPEF